MGGKGVAGEGPTKGLRAAAWGEETKRKTGGKAGNRKKSWGGAKRLDAGGLDNGKKCGQRRPTRRGGGRLLMDMGPKGKKRKLGLSKPMEGKGRKGEESL